MVMTVANRPVVSICMSAFISACSVAPVVGTTEPSEGSAKVRAAIESAVASSDIELTRDSSTTSGRRQATVQCDTRWQHVRLHGR